MKITVVNENSKKVETIDLKCTSFNDAFKKIDAWKKSKANDKNYRIAYYERNIFNEKEHKLLIDFGDYSKFILIKCNKKEWNDLLNWKSSRKVKLEV